MEPKQTASTILICPISFQPPTRRASSSTWPHLTSRSCWSWGSIIWCGLCSTRRSGRPTGKSSAPSSSPSSASSSWDTSTTDTSFIVTHWVSGALTWQVVRLHPVKPHLNLMREGSLTGLISCTWGTFLQYMGHARSSIVKQSGLPTETSLVWFKQPPNFLQCNQPTLGERNYLRWGLLG